MATLAYVFSIEIEFGVDSTQLVPLMQQSMIKEGLCLSTFGLNKAVHSSKRRKNAICKARLSAKIKPMTANTRVKDKYVKAGMIYT
jgi:hypothetical protein